EGRPTVDSTGAPRVLSTRKAVGAVGGPWRAACCGYRVQIDGGIGRKQPELPGGGSDRPRHRPPDCISRGAPRAASPLSWLLLPARGRREGTPSNPIQGAVLRS